MSPSWESSGRPWRIGIRHPRRGDVLLGTVELTQAGGDLRRLRALFFQERKTLSPHPRPAHGLSTEGPQQVTLVANDFEQVNGYTLAIMVRGADWGRALISQTPGLSGLIVDHASQLWSSPGMEKLWLPAPTPHHP